MLFMTTRKGSDLRRLERGPGAKNRPENYSLVSASTQRGIGTNCSPDNNRSFVSMALHTHSA